jgi:hypothetical protein
MNKDGNLDRAVLLTPNSDRNDRLGNITGTPLKDRCRNLMLLVGQPNGLPPVPNFLPWSSQIGHVIPYFISRGTRRVCTHGANPARLRSEPLFSPLGVDDRIYAVQDTLRYEWSEIGVAEEAIAYRIEAGKVRVLGADFTSFGGDESCFSIHTTVNPLTRVQTRTNNSLCGEGMDGGNSTARDGVAERSTLKQRGPIFVQSRPLRGVASSVQEPEECDAPLPPLPSPTASELAVGFKPDVQVCGLDCTPGDYSDCSGCQPAALVVPIGSTFIASDGRTDTFAIAALDTCGLWIQRSYRPDCIFDTDLGCSAAPQAQPPTLLRRQSDGSFLLEDDWANFTQHNLKIEPLSDDRFRVTAAPESSIP